MKEMSKSVHRRMRSPNFVTRYFAGVGIDIGGFPDPLSLYVEFFPKIVSVDTWDREDGDAQYMEAVADNAFDFVVSSHCLEHLEDPYLGIANWFRIIKPGGYLVVTVPEEDLYEQNVWPSNKNLDHKWTFTINKNESWSPKSINVLDLVRSLGDTADIRDIHVEDAGYRYSLENFDQTLTPLAESAIEFIIRKRTVAEQAEQVNRIQENNTFDSKNFIYLNQYLDDAALLRSYSKEHPPFRKTIYKK